MAASVATMNRQVFFSDSDVMGGIVRVWVSNSVWANALHDTLVLPPVQGPLPHVMIGWIMDATMLAATLGFLVGS